MTTTPNAGVRSHAPQEEGTARRADDTRADHARPVRAAARPVRAILSSTIVTNALPRIISDLGGGQCAYTWVVTSSLLAVTASTPLWGKLADQFSKKILVQSALIVFVVGSWWPAWRRTPPR